MFDKKLKVRRKTRVGLGQYGLYQGGRRTSTANNNPIESLFASGVPPGAPFNDGIDVSLGTKFSVSVAGRIIGARMYHPDTTDAAYKAKLYDNAGNLLASKLFPSSTTAEWMTVNFDTPISILANTIYVTSVYSPLGHYWGVVNYFNDPVVNGHITGIDTDVSPNGVFVVGDVFPTSSFSAACYFVDVLFQAN